MQDKDKWMNKIMSNEELYGIFDDVISEMLLFMDYSFARLGILMISIITKRRSVLSMELEN